MTRAVLDGAPEGGAAGDVDVPHVDSDPLTHVSSVRSVVLLSSAPLQSVPAQLADVIVLDAFVHDILRGEEWGRRRGRAVKSQNVVGHHDASETQLHALRAATAHIAEFVPSEKQVLTVGKRTSPKSGPVASHVGPVPNTIVRANSGGTVAGGAYAPLSHVATWYVATPANGGASRNGPHGWKTSSKGSSSSGSPLQSGVEYTSSDPDALSVHASWKLNGSGVSWEQVAAGVGVGAPRA